MQLRFAVFGAGNSNWAATYQKIPMEIDNPLALIGSQRRCPLFKGDDFKDIESDFESWLKTLLSCYLLENPTPSLRSLLLEKNDENRKCLLWSILSYFESESRLLGPLLLTNHRFLLLLDPALLLFLDVCRNLSGKKKKDAYQSQALYLFLDAGPRTKMICMQKNWKGMRQKVL